MLIDLSLSRVATLEPGRRASFECKVSEHHSNDKSAAEHPNHGENVIIHDCCPTHGYVVLPFFFLVVFALALSAATNSFATF